MRDDPSVPHQTFALGSLAEALPDVAVIDLGPDHPTRAGLVRIRLRHNNSTVYAADVQPGALHRGAEMIFEVREYRQLLSLANRHDWQAPFFGELLIARLVEESLGIATSQRVRWLRVLLAEHFRIISHVAYLSFVEITLKGDLGGSRHARANLLERSLELTGNRVHPMVVRLGGSAADLTPGWAQRERHALDEVRGWAAELGAALEADGRWRGLAVTPDAIIRGYGLTGPAARAAGHDLDLRRTGLPDDLAGLLDVPTESAGDAHTRFAVLVSQLHESCRLIEACLDGLPEGPVGQQLPKVIKVPEGDWYASVEAPWGHAGAFLVSRGDKAPWRLKLRTPSFNQVSAWSAVLPGCPLEDLPAALASLPYVAGDLDK